MEIRTLRYFLAVAREENMSRAAELLHVTQPTLSKALKGLEDELGKKLFTRNSFSIAGKLFVMEGDLSYNSLGSADVMLFNKNLAKDLGLAAPYETVLEGGNRFLVNWTEGQKTGFFLDQRENRAAVGRLSRGRNVLNLFCYTGGFSIYALAGGAVHVDSVDSSKKAMDMVDRNVALNGFDSSMHTSYCCDAIDFLRTAQEGKYDLMIVDPPAFAKHRGALENALRAYQRLNAAAISKVAPGGLIFTFSCSQVVDKEAFALAVFSAAAQAGRSVRILDRMNQPADHAVNIYHPEGEYLKGLLLYVE